MRHEFPSSSLLTELHFPINETGSHSSEYEKDPGKEAKKKEEKEEIIGRFKTKLLDELKISFEKVKTPAEGTGLLFEFYKILREFPAIYLRVNSSDLAGVINHSDVKAKITFDFDLIDERLRENLFGLSIAFKHYEWSFIFLMKQLLYYHEISKPDETLSLLKKLDHHNMNWFSRTLSLVHTVYSSMENDMRDLVGSEEHLRLQFILRSVRDHFQSVLKKYVLDSRTEYELLNREIIYLTRERVEFGPLKLISDVTSIDRIRGPIWVLIKGEMTALTHAFGDPYVPFKEEVLDPFERVRNFVDLGNRIELTILMSHLDIEAYCDAFRVEFKARIDRKEFSQLGFMLSALDKKAFHQLFTKKTIAEDMDLFGYCLTKICPSTKKKAAAGAGAKEADDGMSLVVVTMLDFIGSISDQITLLKKYLNSSTLAKVDYEVSNKIDHLFFSLLSSLNLSYFASHKASREEVDGVIKKICDCKINYESLVHKFWLTYLYFKIAGETRRELDLVVAFLEQVLCQIAGVEKFSVLNEKLSEKLREEKGFLSLKVQYTLKYIFSSERREAEAIEREEIERSARSLAEDPADFFNEKFSRLKISGPSTDELIKTLDENFTVLSSLYARFAFLTDFLSWTKKNNRLKKINFEQILLVYLLRHSSVISQLSMSLSRGSTTAVDEFEAINTLTRDKECLASFDLEAWVKSLVFTKDNAADFLLLYLFLTRVSTSNESYQSVVFLVKRILRASAQLYLSSTEAYPQFEPLLDMAAKHRFFERLGESELKLILLENTLPSSLSFFAETRPTLVSDRYLASESMSKGAEVLASGREAKGASRKRKNAERSKEPHPGSISDQLIKTVSVIPTQPSPAAIAAAPFFACAETQTASPKTNASVGSASVSGLSLMTAEEVVADARVVIKPSITVFDEQISKLQSLRIEVSKIINELLLQLNERFKGSEEGSQEKNLLKALIDHVEENKKQINLLRNDLKKIKESKSLTADRASSTVQLLPIPTWAECYIDSCHTLLDSMINLLEAMGVDESCAILTKSSIQVLLKNIKNFQLPIVENQLLEKFSILAVIERYSMDLATSIAEFSPLYEQFLSYYPTQTPRELHCYLLKDFNNLWHLLHDTYSWVSSLNNYNFYTQQDFISRIVSLPKPESQLKSSIDDNYFSVGIENFVRKFNLGLSEFALKLSDLLLDKESSCDYFLLNLTHLLDHLKANYFSICHVPVANDLVDLLKAFGELRLAGSQLTMDCPLDIDAKFWWANVTDSYEEILSKLCPILAEKGFVILELKKLSFAEIIFIRIAPKGYGFTIYDHLPIDLSVYYGRSAYAQVNYAAQAALCFDPQSGRMSCDKHENALAVLEGTFSMHMPDPSGHFGKDLRATAHILKMLIRAWYKAKIEPKKMVLSDEANKLVVRLKTYTGDLVKLKAGDFLLEQALRLVVSEFFTHYYCHSENFVWRGLMLLEFCQEIGLKVVAKLPETNLYCELLRVDTVYGCFDFSFGESNYDISSSLLVEPTNDFMNANTLAVMSRSYKMLSTASASLFGMPMDPVPTFVAPESGFAMTMSAYSGAL